MTSVDQSRPASALRAWSATLGLSVLVVIGLMLCVWQIGRAYDKRALQADLSLKSTTAASAVPIAQVNSPIDRQPVLLSGKWVDGSVIYLDNRANRGRAGVHTLQALRLLDGRLVWVNRGWMAKAPGEIDPRRQDFERGLLGLAVGTVERVTALTFLDEMRRLELAASADLVSQSHLWQNFDLGLATNRLRALGEQGAVLSAVFWLVPETTRALAPQAGLDQPIAQLPPLPDDAESQHWGYALQWALLSVAAAVFAFRLSPQRRPLSSTPLQ